MKIAELFRVDGQVAMVTGGASGIGYACAEVWPTTAQQSASLIAMLPSSTKRKQGLPRASPDVMTEQVDVTDRASMRKAVAHVVDRFKRLDIAFINAGIGGGPGFLDMSGKRNPAGAVETSRRRSSGTVMSPAISPLSLFRSRASCRSCARSRAAASSSRHRWPH